MTACGSFFSFNDLILNFRQKKRPVIQTVFFQEHYLKTLKQPEAGDSRHPCG